MKITLMHNYHGNYVCLISKGNLRTKIRMNRGKFLNHQICKISITFLALWRYSVLVGTFLNLKPLVPPTVQKVMQSPSNTKTFFDLFGHNYCCY